MQKESESEGREWTVIREFLHVVSLRTVVRVQPFLGSSMRTVVAEGHSKKVKLSPQARNDDRDVSTISTTIPS